MDIKKDVLEKDSGLITMVDRALSIVDYIYAQENYVGVSEISRELDIPKANAFRILKTLEKCEEGEASILVSRLIPISPMYCSSIGKVFLANMNNKELEEYFSNEDFNLRTVNTITSMEKFLEEKDTILGKNIAYDNEEYEYGLTCISAPIYNFNKEIVACISISGPTSRLKFKGLEKIENKLLNITNKISSSVEILE